MALKQQKFILSCFEGQESEVSITGLKSRCQGAVLPPETLGRICSLRLPAACGCQHFSHFHSAFVVTLPRPVCKISLCLPLRRILLISLKAHTDNPELCCHFNILDIITSAKILYIFIFWPWILTFPVSRDLDLISLDACSLEEEL